MKGIAVRYQRIAAVAILLALLALPITAVLLFAEFYQSNLDEIAARQARIARFEAIARYGSQLDVQRAEAPDVTRAQWFLPGSDPAIAAAGLQAKLKELAGRHGIEVTQARDLKPRNADGVIYVGVGLEMSGEAQGLAALLGAIEANVPLLIIKRSDMRAELSGSDPRYDPVRLYLSLDVWGALSGSVGREDQADRGT